MHTITQYYFQWASNLIDGKFQVMAYHKDYIKNFVVKREGIGICEDFFYTYLPYK